MSRRHLRLTGDMKKASPNEGSQVVMGVGAAFSSPQPQRTTRARLPAPWRLGWAQDVASARQQPWCQWAWPQPMQPPRAGGSKHPKKQPTKSPPHPTLLKKKIKKNKNGHQHLPGEEKSKWRCQALAVQEQGVSTPGPDTAALDEASSKKQQQTQPQPLCNG